MVAQAPSGRELWGTATQPVLAVGLAIGLAVGLATGLEVGLATGLKVGLATGLAVGLATGLTVGLATGLATGLDTEHPFEAALIANCWLTLDDQAPPVSSLATQKKAQPLQG